MNVCAGGPGVGRSPGRRGVALIVVLWAVALISTAMLGLAAILQRQLGQELAGLRNVRASLVAESGVQMVLNPAVDPALAPQAARVLSGILREGWDVPVEFSLRTEDLRGEGGRINLNALALGDREEGRRILMNLLGSWDVNPTTSSAFIDALFDYVDADNLATGVNEATEDYSLVGRDPPRNAPLERVDELEKILGWDEVLAEANVPNWRDKFSVYGPGRLNLRSDDRDVIEAWLSLPNGAAQRFVDGRTGPDQILGTRDDQPDPALLGSNRDWGGRIFLGPEDLWRVTSTGDVGGVKRTLVALVSRNPPQVRARWLEEQGP